MKDTKRSKQAEPTFEEVKLQFIKEWEDGHSPTLPDYIKRYPQFADQLVEFVMEFLSMENAAERLTESPIVPDSTLEILDKMMAGARAEVRNLTEARDAMALTVDQLSEQLDLPSWITMKLEEGLIRDWPAKLEEALAAILCRTRSQIAALLQGGAPTPAATNFKAKGQPKTTTKVRTFHEALEACHKEGMLTPAQRRKWLEDS